MAQKLRKCPECEKLYTDEQIIYCLDDGTPLKKVQVVEMAEDTIQTLPIIVSEVETELFNKARVIPQIIDEKTARAIEKKTPLIESPAKHQSEPDNSPIFDYITLVLILIFFAAVAFGVFIWLLETRK